MLERRVFYTKDSALEKFNGRIVIVIEAIVQSLEEQRLIGQAVRAEFPDGRTREVFYDEIGGVPTEGYI